MPELPDVEATRRYQVAEGLLRHKIVGADLLWPQAVKTPPLEDFVLTLRGKRVEEVGRRAKYLLFMLEGGHVLIIHLRMTGSLLLEPASAPRHPMTRNVFLLDKGRELRFVDPRKLGMMWLLEDAEPMLKHLGPEPLEPEFTPEVFQGRLQGRRNAPIKALLCDQGIIAGIGNIYADEVLFAAGIGPLRPGANLSPEEAGRLPSGHPEGVAGGHREADQGHALWWPSHRVRGGLPTSSRPQAEERPLLQVWGRHRAGARPWS